MRPLFIFVCILSSFQNCFAQTYNLFQPNAVPYFISQDHHLKGIRIDSVKNINGETHYFLYHTPRGTLNYIQTIMDRNGGSWVGKEVIEHQDGLMIIPTYWKDTVFIHTQARLNDSWRFYDDTSQNYYEATITGYDTATISGVLDSLKIITISAYNDIGMNPADNIHGKQIVLSKDHGIYQTFALYTFPFRQLSLYVEYYSFNTEFDYLNNDVQIFIQQSPPYPTQFQLYDYTPGDYFIYYTVDKSSSWGNVDTIYKERDSIISKNYLTASQIEYVIRVKSILWHAQALIHDSARRDTVNNIVTLDFDTTLMPDEYGSKYFIKYFPIDTSYCLSSSLIVREYNRLQPDLSLDPGDRQILTYKTGLGEIRDETPTISPYFYYKTLSSYHKNNLSCEPLLVKDANNVIEEIQIHPNPATDNLFIKTDLSNYQLSVYNMLGLEIFSKSDVTTNTELIVKDWANGFYFLKIYSKEANAFETRKFIVQH